MDPQFASLDHVHMVELWFQAKGEKPPLEPKLAERLERWRQADLWMRKHASVSKVWPMMQAKYKYSATSAREDVEDAQRFFGKMPVQKKAYWAGLVLDFLGESMIKAIGDRKWGDVARLAKEIREYLDFQEEVSKIDPKDFRRAVPRRIAVQPEILLVQHDTQAQDRVLALVRKLKGEETTVDIAHEDVSGD